MFEQYGVAVMQQILATNYYLEYKGKTVMASDMSDSLLPWLTEQYDRAERRETWSIMMEVAITVFVAAELGLSIFSLAAKGR